MPSAVVAFEYDSPGKLVPGSGSGRVDNKVYFNNMRFPIENSPAYANSQVYRPGGFLGGGGAQCDSSNYSYPWQDNFCETRRWSMPLCPGGTGHQGQDIRPATCVKDKHWAVATESGRITNIGSYSVTLVGDSGIRHRYLHMNKNRLNVSTGQRVTKGQRLGLVSNFFGGTPTTIHLHYDMFSGGRYIPTYMSLVNSYKTLLGEPDTPPPPTGSNTYKRAVTASPADFDGDGFDDIYWYRYGDATDYLWYGRGRDFDSGLSEGRTFKAVRHQISGDYLPISGDYDGNGIDDIFWYRPGTGQDVVFYGNNSGEFSAVNVTVSQTYTPVAADFDNNGIDDIFWYAPGTAKDSIWRGKGNVFIDSPIQINGNYDPVSGDFNGDGFGDIFWYAAGAGADYISYSSGADFTYAPKNAVPIIGSYNPVKGDFDGDGYSDIFWYKPNTANDDWVYYGTADHEFTPVKKSVASTYVAVP